MKKVILTLVAIGILAGVGYVVYEKMMGGPVKVTEILPQNVSMYVQFDDVEENLQQLTSMPIWQGLSRINYDRILSEGNANGQQLVLFKLIKTQVMEAINSPLAKRLFGNEVAFAVYSASIDPSTIGDAQNILDPRFLEEILSGLYLVTRVDPDVQFAEFISRFFSEFGSNVSQRETNYNGETIRTITVNSVGISFGMVRLDDLIVIGVGEKPAMMSVDVYKKVEPALSDDPTFAGVAKRFLKPANMTSYFNFEDFMSMVRTQGEAWIAMAGPEQKRQWEKVFDQIAGIKAFSSSSQLKPLIRIDNRLTFDPVKLDADYADLYTCPGIENRTINFTPQDVLGYYWNNCLNLDHYWKEFKKELANLSPEENRVAQMEAGIGLSIERDILPAFGDEIGGYIQDIRTNALFPVPKFLMFVEVGDRAKADNLLAKLQDQPMMVLQEENYKGTPIKFLGIQLGEDVQPAYAFVQNYLLISSSKSLIHQSIDVAENPTLSLKSNADFRSVNVGLTESNRNVQFLRVGQIIEKVKNIINWSNQWVTAQDRKAEAFKAGSTKPLEEAQTDITALEGEVGAIREQMVQVEDDIWNMETKGEDVTAKQAELDTLQQQMDDKKQEILDKKERVEQLAQVVDDMDEKKMDPEMRQFFIDEVVYPILDSLKSIQAYGLRSTVRDNGIESSLLLKVIE